MNLTCGALVAVLIIIYRRLVMKNLGLFVAFFISVANADEINEMTEPEVSIEDSSDGNFPKSTKYPYFQSYDSEKNLLIIRRDCNDVCGFEFITVDHPSLGKDNFVSFVDGQVEMVLELND